MPDRTVTDELRRRWSLLSASRGWDGARATPAVHRLLAKYGEPHRAYHNQDHLLDCLTELDAVRPLCDDPVDVELALWFHDAEYDPAGPENERTSAGLAIADLDILGESERVRRVWQLILDTAHRSDPATPDGRLVVDIDLSILGKEPARFDNYDRAIRAEYAHVPEADYRAGRAAVLWSFLDRPSIYRTERFADRYERPARENLARAIERLTSA